MTVEMGAVLVVLLIAFAGVLVLLLYSAWQIAGLIREVRILSAAMCSGMESLLVILRSELPSRRGDGHAQ
jgi:hypothetical protein